VPDYAVIALGGKQYRVEAGEKLLVDRLAHEPGDSFSPTVLATGTSGGGLNDGGSVTMTVEEHLLGPKLLVFTYRAKKDSKRKRGHRSRLSRVRIDSIA
jgi:large subunit ribosomal protein L21